MTIDYARLRELAEAATPGPWVAEIGSPDAGRLAVWAERDSRPGR